MVQPPDTALEIRLASPVAALVGVSKRRAQVLARLGIESISDLLRHLPMRYEMEYAESDIQSLPAKGVASVRGLVTGVRFVPRQRWQQQSKSRFEAILNDGKQPMQLVWFNADYLKDKLHAGQTIRVQGQAGRYNGYPQMINPRWELLELSAQTPTKEERLRPVYPATEELPSKAIEQLVAQALPAVLAQLTDPLSEAFLKERQMPSLAQAYRMVHQPVEEQETVAGRRRLAFNELLLLQMGIALKRHYNKTKLSAPALSWSASIDKQIRQCLPFALTASQNQVIQEIVEDIQTDRPMNRLLQGDVGAGKTAVALYGLLMAVVNRRQGALMAPTELLAQQHYQSIGNMLQGTSVRLALLSSGESVAGSAARKAMLREIEQGRVDIVVGTQALLSESVRFHDLALVVVDEQHRFGVMQRAAFRDRAEAEQAHALDKRTSSPHYLVMTATPIPRSLSLTVFGDLDVSTITGLPPGRGEIITRWVQPDQSPEVYQYVAKRVAQGEQAYIVVPAIEETEGQHETKLKSVQSHQKELAEKYFVGSKVDAIHGRLKPQTRQAIMNRFAQNKTQVLVATTVIEVGVDVPNATIIIIEHAERFGLAQLHQLRGRVGRGSTHQKSLCVLIGDPVTPESQKRLETIVKTRDGFKIAEADLLIRGMGDFFGTRQHGSTPLRVARIPDDMDLIQMARRDANELIRHDPALMLPDHALLKKILISQYGQTLGLIDVG